MKLQYSRSPRVQFVLVGLAVFLLFSGCINPFSGNNDSDSASGARGDGTRYGSIVITPSGGVSAQTVAPDISNLKSLIDTYDVTLTDPAPGGLPAITVNGYVEGSAIENVPYGTWTISLVGRSGVTQIATAEVTGFEVNAATNPVTIQLAPSMIGSGTLNYTLNFPAAEVDGAAVTLDPWPAGGGDELTLASGTDYNADFGTTGSLTISGTYASDTYLMTIQLSDSTASGNGNHAPVVKIVQIFDTLDSIGADTLTLADLRSPPDAPSNLVIEYSNTNSMVVRWADNSNTESGFRVYASSASGGLTRAQVGVDIAAGSTASPTLDSGLPGPSDDLVVEVVAFNAFGESASASVEFRALGTNQLPMFNPFGSDRTNNASWVAAADPGDIGGSTLIVGGADSVDLWIGTADVYGDVTSLPVATVANAGPTYDLAGLPGGLTAGATYYYRVRAVTTGGEIYYPGGSFTVRDGVLYVDGTNGTTGAAGSAVDPVDSLSEAISLAETSEEIRVAAGTYAEALPALHAGARLTGSWDAGFTTQAFPPTTTVRNTGNRYTFDVGGSNYAFSNLFIQAGGSDEVTTGAVNFGGNGTLTIERSTLEAGNGAATTTTGAVGIRASGGVATDSIIVRESTLTVDETAGAGSVWPIWILNSYSGSLTIDTNSSFGPLSSSGLTSTTSFAWLQFQAGANANPLDLTIDSVTFAASTLGGATTTHLIDSDRPNANISITNSTLEEVADDPAATSESYGIQAFRGASSIVLEDNTFTMGNSEGNSYAVSVGGRIDTGATVSGAFRIARNRFLNGVPGSGGSAYAIDVRWGGPDPGDPTALPAGPEIVNNVFRAQNNSALFYYAVNLDTAPATVLHNTFAMEGTGPSRLVRLVDSGSGSDNHDIRNNVFTNPGGGTSIGVAEFGTVTYGSVANNVFDGTAEATPASIRMFNSNAWAQYNVSLTPSGLDLDAADWYAPIDGNTHYRVRSGGVDLTGTVPTDINGVTRTAGTGVSVGAYELDDARTIAIVFFNGRIGGAGGEQALFSAPVVDNGTTLSATASGLTNIADPLNDVDALDYTDGVDDGLYYMNGLMVRRVGASSGVITSIADLSTISGLNLSSANADTQDMYLWYNDVALTWDFFVADFNQGFYYVREPAAPINSNIEDLSTNGVVGPQGRAIVSDGVRAWTGIGEALSSIDATAVDAAPQVIEVLPAGNINDISFNGGLGGANDFWMAVGTTNLSDGYIAVDRDDGPGSQTTDRIVIIDETQTVGEPRALYYDRDDDVMFWTEVATLDYNTTIRAAFGDGFTIGPGIQDLFTGGTGAGLVDRGGKLAVRP